MDGNNEVTIPLTTVAPPPPTTTNHDKQPNNNTPELHHPHHPHHHNRPLLSEAEVKMTKEKKEEEEEEGDRIHWGSKWEYVLSTVGYCVGLGNIFRFPYLCNRNGGGAFLIPFVLSLILIGLPLFALEVIVGQFSGLNVYTAWSVCPLFKGAGLGVLMIASICFWYYNTLLAWALYYLVSTFRSEVPWSSCDQWWNTPQCVTYLTPHQNESLSRLGNATTTSSSTSAFPGNASMMSSEFGMTPSVSVNASQALRNTSAANLNVTGAGYDVTALKRVSAAEEFWQHNVLQLSSGLGDPGSVVWYLALALMVTLLFLFLALVKGIRTSGKVVYVTATAPYVLLTILLVRGAMLPGAIDGIIFYLRPDFSKLMDPQVWVEAALQVFYSLGPCWGGLIVMASYNKFDNNCLRDSLVLTLVTEGTSIFGGFAIFSVLGYMAYASGQNIEDVVSSGPGLAFIVYPEAISLMPLPQLWAVLFFLNIIALGFDSQMTMAETVLVSIMDFLPAFLRHRRSLTTALFCLFFLLLSLPFVTQGGMYVFQLVDWFVAALSCVIIGLLECVVVGWIYGVHRFGGDVYLMLGRRPPFILNLFWKYITPGLLLPLLVMTLVNYVPPSYGDYVYGPWGLILGWSVALASFLPIPLMALYQLGRARGSIKQRLRQTLRADYTLWKPVDATARLSYPAEKQPCV